MPEASDATPTENRTVDWTRALPEPCRLLVVRNMDSSSRAVWRLVNTQACRDVHAATHQLTWKPTVAEESPDEESPDDSMDSCPVGLPAALISKLASLHTLQCGSMQLLTSIQGIPPTLRSLDLTDCSSIQDLSSLQHCTMLEHLTLCGFYYHPEPLVQSLPAVMSTLSACLRHLSIQLSELQTRSPSTDQAVLQSLRPLTRLHTLRLRLDHLPSEDWQGFAGRLGAMTGLQQLDLRSQHTGPAMPALAQAIRQLKHLRGLQLGSTRCGSEGGAALAQALVSLPAQLTELGVVWSDAPAATLAPALRAQSATLAVLQLGHNSFGAEGMAALAPGLGLCTALTELGLEDNNAQAQGAAALAGALAAVVPSLTSLNLTMNEIGADGAAALAPALGAMTALTCLGCGYNSLGPEGLRALAGSVKGLPLREWDLYHNGLGFEGAEVLASALSGMTRLRCLKDYELDFGSEGVALVQAAVAALPGLTLDTQPPEDEDQE